MPISRGRAEAGERTRHPIARWPSRVTTQTGWARATAGACVADLQALIRPFAPAHHRYWPGPSSR